MAQRGHARCCRGIIGEVDGRYVRLDDLIFLNQLLGLTAERRSDLAGTTNSPAFERAPVQRPVQGVVGSMIPVITLPPFGLAYRAEDRNPRYVADCRTLLGAPVKTSGHLPVPFTCGCSRSPFQVSVPTFIPIQRREYLRAHFLAAHLECDVRQILIPHAGTSSCPHSSARDVDPPHGPLRDLLGIPSDR